MRHGRKKLSDVITEQLESMILDGTLLAGQQLPPERELATQFDVSRPSLREAIGNLQARGLVERKQGGGTFVSRNLNAAMTDPLMALISRRPETQFDLLEFRHALEGMAAYYAALRGQPEDYQALQAALDNLPVPAPGESKRALAEAVGEFYMVMARASHNMVLLHVMSTMQTMLVENIERNFEMFALHQNDEIDINAEVRRQRKEILAAIASRDPEAARQACNAHLALIEKTLLAINQRDSRVQRALRRLEI
ncbi:MULTISPECIES: GntR family transcriptional regulator [unclassified Alteromonas]|uniref:GntR family transcriptional regulator n=1 Tax=unclassified Alteromonas TaxID=2614992 RepID=UPI000C676D83|nr:MULTISPECIES: GntR family transcriptional regulator [unclassified Alteromonas]AYA65299.1 GntR family transcriptional regulator [Alteromonas sp. RKMC-009]MBT82190.1 transcriptional regulator PdhR [Alteromonadaceae bacterium]MDO6474793.1 GntR family transcriptional regulator [Alteromonas sp. 1_MG-2023]